MPRFFPYIGDLPCKGELAILQALIWESFITKLFYIG